MIDLKEEEGGETTQEITEIDYKKSIYLIFINNLITQQKQ